MKGGQGNVVTKDGHSTTRRSMPWQKEKMAVRTQSREAAHATPVPKRC
jgi:hypothetical protein